VVIAFGGAELFEAHQQLIEAFAVAVFSPVAIVAAEQTAGIQEVGRRPAVSIEPVRDLSRLEIGDGLQARAALLPVWSTFP
jgi:hypothetical protein